MTTSELVLQTLSGHHEQSVGQLFKKLAGQPGINNSKSVSNALMRLKKDGRVTNTFDADRAIWLWRAAKEGEVASQSECQADHSEHDLEMASDITEINHESLVETREPDADGNADDASQTAAADAVPVSDQTEAQAGWASEAVADTSNVLGISVQARHETSAAKPATMPVGIAIAEFGSYSWREGTTLAEVFMTGIAYAEEYHGIGPNENGDYK